MSPLIVFVPMVHVGTVGMIVFHGFVRVLVAVGSENGRLMRMAVVPVIVSMRVLVLEPLVPMNVRVPLGHV
jgi:hypothetical protein